MERIFLAAMDEQGHLAGVGRAPRVGLGTRDGRRLLSWQVIDVDWDRAHDQENEGSHHARVARFLREHHVQELYALRAGDDMRRMIGQLGIEFRTSSGDARQAIEALST